MMRITTAVLICATVALAACGRGDSSFNPFRMNRQAPTTLEPKEGYGTTTRDDRLPIAHLTGAKMDQILEGKLLTVTAMPATKGWWNVALVPATPAPAGRIVPDADGVLRLNMVGLPPLPGSTPERQPASSQVDSITAGLSLSHVELRQITRIEITSASNRLTVTP